MDIRGGSLMDRIGRRVKIKKEFIENMRTGKIGRRDPKYDFISEHDAWTIIEEGTKELEGEVLIAAYGSCLMVPKYAIKEIL